jgi:hypothetical protein
VQRGRNNPPVKKGSKAYCKSFLSFCLLPPYFCLLALDFLQKLDKGERLRGKGKAFFLSPCPFDPSPPLAKGTFARGLLCDYLGKSLKP